MRLPVHAYEPWHGDLPDGPMAAMHMDRERSVIAAEQRDIKRRQS